MSYKNPWLWKDGILDSADIENYVGMVYRITHKTSGKFYIGKKFFWKVKYRIVKGKKKKYKGESDWKEYWGSSRSLQYDIEKYGKNMFKREVLKLCKNKTECAYYEMKEQIDSESLLREDSYNEFIGGKINGRNLR